MASVIAWSGDYSAAIAVYDSVLTREPRNRDAVLGRAQTLAWAGRFTESLAAYKQWTTSRPTDREAAIDYARALAWNGRLDEAEALYTDLARTATRRKKGLARVLLERRPAARRDVAASPGHRNQRSRGAEDWRRSEMAR